MPKIDLTNQVYGRLTVLHEYDKDPSGKIRWLCQCSCGNQKVVRGGDLRSGRTQSCGCLQKERTSEKTKELARSKIDNPSFRIDLTNRRFGRLTVLEFDAEYTKQKRAELNNKFSYWKCRCDCGNIISVCSVNLTQQKTQSCGCLAKETSKKNMQKIQPLGAAARFQDLTGQYFNNILVLERYKENNSQNKPQWVCQCHCGNIFITNGTVLKNGDVQSCGCIGKSIGEHKIKHLLLENNIAFRQEVKFEDLKDKNYLRFDFGLLNDNDEIIKLIEFDGRQHSDVISIWHTELVELHDQQKNNYCKEHNIPLLRISYLDLDKITIDQLLYQTTEL